VNRDIFTGSLEGRAQTELAPGPCSPILRWRTDLQPGQNCHGFSGGEAGLPMLSSRFIFALFCLATSAAQVLFGSCGGSVLHRARQGGACLATQRPANAPVNAVISRHIELDDFADVSGVISVHQPDAGERSIQFGAGCQPIIGFIRSPVMFRAYSPAMSRRTAFASKSEPPAAMNGVSQPLPKRKRSSAIPNIM
jgi:hypothetical protein